MLPRTEILKETITLPISKQKITVRAITTKEERLLLMMNESSSKDDVETLNNLTKELKEFIACCIEDKTNIGKLSNVDINTIFLKIMELSRGNIVHHMYKCNNLVDNPDGSKRKCGSLIPVSVDLKTVQYKNVKDSNLVKLNDTLGVELTFPSLDTIEKANKLAKNDEISSSINAVALSILSVIDGEEVYTEFSDEEIIDWYLNLPMEYSDKIAQYIIDEPTMYLEYTMECPSCHNQTHVVLEDITSFFTSTIQEKV